MAKLRWEGAPQKVCSHVARASDRHLDYSSAHDTHEEHNRDALENEIDEREEECDGANVLERLPRVGVLERLAVPDLLHDHDPQDVHNDCHYCQPDQL